MLPRPETTPVRLGDLAAQVPGSRVIGDADVQIRGVELDSRQVRPGDLFAALPGHLRHGAAFVPSALASGATAILTDEAGLALMHRDRCPAGTPVLVIEGPRQVLGSVARMAYGSPGDAMTLLGITGTNGKTTVAFMLESGLRAAGMASGLVGTVGVHIRDEQLPASRTTPESPHLHALLAVMRQTGVQAVALEVSSHALCEGRVDGLRFDVAGFTNLTQDHLDYHGSMSDYFAAKASLFTPERSALGVVGIDDEWGHRLAREATVPVQTWSVAGHAADWTLAESGAGWTVRGPGGEQQDLAIHLPGSYNRANGLCAYVMLRASGVDAQAAAAGIAAVQVPGRMERVAPQSDVVGIVDYAHSPDAVGRAINAIRPTATGRIIVVLGAGGDRDRTKRPLMGQAAGRAADVVIVTDDNPRTEDPEQIRLAVLAGAQAVHPADSVWHVPDRRAAIQQAAQAAQPGDVVLLLGKGHEQGQEIGGVMHPFDDRAELRAALDARRPGGAA